MKRVGTSLLFLLGYILAIFAVVLATRGIANEMMRAFLYQITILFVFYFLLKKTNISLFNKGWLRLKNIVIIGVGFLIKLFVLPHIAELFPEVPFENQAFIEEMVKNESVWLIFITLVILGPIVEEILFRGILMRYLFTKKYQLIGLLFSSVLFAWAHGAFDPQTFVIYGGMGLLLGSVYWLTDSLECAILYHVLNNFIATFALIYMIGEKL